MKRGEIVLQPDVLGSAATMLASYAGLQRHRTNGGLL